MEGFWGAPLAANRRQGLILFPVIGEEEVVFPQDGRLMHLQRLGLPAAPVFQRVLQNPDEYLQPRYAPFVELSNHWEEFSGDNYLGLQQHRQEELDAPEQVEDTDNEEEDSDDENDTMDCTEASLLNDIGSSSSSIASIGLQDTTMPGSSPATFVPILEPVTTSEVRKRTSDQVDRLGA